jgi:hypothetical protein
MTAGLDEVRGSGPQHLCCVRAQRLITGLSDPRLDWFVITPSPPPPTLQTPHPAPGGSLCGRSSRSAITLVALQDGQATRVSLLAMAVLTTLAGRRAKSALIHPAAAEALPRACRKSVVAPSTRSRRRYRSPCLEMCPSRTLPPVPLWRGTKPIQAAKWRPERKERGSGMGAA